MIEKIIKKIEKGVGLDVDKVTLTSDEASFLLKFLKEEEKEKERLREKADLSIDFKYAMTQVEVAAREAKTDLERQVIEGFRGVLLVLPNRKDLKRHVYCSECEYFSATEEDIYCPYSDLCQLWDPEDSAPLSKRPCYLPKEENKK